MREKHGLGWAAPSICIRFQRPHGDGREKHSIYKQCKLRIVTCGRAEQALSYCEFLCQMLNLDIEQKILHKF